MFDVANYYKTKHDLWALEGNNLKFLIIENILNYFDNASLIYEDLKKIDEQSAFIELFFLIINNDVELFYKIIDDCKFDKTSIYYKLISYIMFAQTFRPSRASLLIEILKKSGIVIDYDVNSSLKKIITKDVGIIKYSFTKLDFDFTSSIQTMCHQFCEVCLSESDKIKILSGIVESENFEKIYHSVILKDGKIIDPICNLIIDYDLYISMYNFDVVVVFDSYDDYLTKYELVKPNILDESRLQMVSILTYFDNNREIFKKIK